MADGLKIDPRFLQRLERLSLMARRFLSARGVGKRESRNKGASLEFREYRHYVRGDELRYLDWNVYARHGSLFVKEFTAEENVHVAILIDQSSSMSVGEPSKFELAKGLAAALGYIALANFDTLSVWKFSDRISSVRSFLVGKPRIHELLGSLNGLAVEGSSNFARAFEQPLPRLRGKSIVIVISDFYDIEGYRAALMALLSQKVQVDLFQVLTREEVEPRTEGRVLLRDAETGRERDLFITPRARAAYQGRIRGFLDDLDLFARSREIRLLRVYTDELLESIVARAAQGGFLERT